MSYNLEIYNGTQDLSNFFAEAKKRKFYNNSSKEMLIDYLSKYEDSKLFLLYYDNEIVGTSVSHSLKELGILGNDAYRIAARTCVLNNKIGGERVLAVRNYRHSPMNHWTSQMLTPACMYHVGLDRPMYISTNTSEIGSQSKVHKIWSNIMFEQGYLKDPIELEYRGLFQTFWRVDVDFYLKKLQENVWPETLDLLSAQFKISNIVGSTV
jgi:hypothetical protein